ncbi:hypothetical protein AALO_G00110430 [Alosa alosa]|uniref:Uncharacterized protein n=1 Tax=Alosa alosa TaxID=278164 RepID=A0AAV6GNS4_9TELE|nr:hypothetical protein AALO_G00110430 [Alosa alosa]
MDSTRRGASEKKDRHMGERGAVAGVEAEEESAVAAEEESAVEAEEVAMDAGEPESERRQERERTQKRERRVPWRQPWRQERKGLQLPWE